MAGLDAFFTHDTAIGNLLDQWPVIDCLGIDIIGFERLTYDILRVTDVLKVTFAAGITDRAI